MPELQVVTVPRQELGLTNYVCCSSTNNKVIAEILYKNTKYYFSIKYEESIKANQIGMNAKLREFFNIDIEQSPVSTLNVNYVNKKDLTNIEEIEFRLWFVNSSKKNYDVDKPLVIYCDELENRIKEKYKEQLVNLGQAIIIVHEDINIQDQDGKDMKVPLSCQIKKISNNSTVGYITKSTHMTFVSRKDINIIKGTNNLFKKSVNLKEMGIGGLSEEFQTILRRAFISRLVDKKTSDEMKLKHVKGILLFGPPGCGKSLSARQIGKILDCDDPTIVNGPELLNKFVGESEANVRKLFPDPKNNNGKLKLIICDEFDALCKSRGTDVHGDKIVNQFLTMIDGVNSSDNFLLICMTNRKDLIDSAILRAGRLEVQIEIKLQDEKGRLEILAIHTDHLEEKKYMIGVDIKDLAKRTNNFTGAEIESLVKSAESYALSREIEFNDDNGVSNKKIHPIITTADFDRALDEIIPMFGSISTELETYVQEPFIFWNKELSDNFNILSNKIKTLQNGNMFTVLLSGSSYCGKTKFISHAVTESNVGCIKRISPDKILHLTEHGKSQHIINVFEEALKTKDGIVILDNLERLLDYVEIGPRFSNTILQTILSLLRKDVYNKLTAILITSDYKMAELFGLDNIVDKNIIMPDELDDYARDKLEETYGDRFDTSATISEALRELKFMNKRQDKENVQYTEKNIMDV